MALELKDRIWTDCVSTGTDDAWIGEPKEGYQGWESITPNNTVYYCITDNTSWEVGYGNYVNAFGAGDNASKAIKRNLITSNTGALLDLSGNASIFCTYPAEKSVYLDVDGNIQLPEVNVRFKGITGNEVISPVVATGAVIVDGTEAEGGDLAKLLDVYTKDEIQDKINEQDRKNTGKFMPQSGGTFTGAVDFNKTITINNNFTQVRASVDKPFHTLKTNAPLNADGSQNTDEPFGLAVDLDNNNTNKNRFVVKSRLGETIVARGGPAPSGNLSFDWTYNGLIDKNHHIANKEYVDNSVADLDSSINLHTLSNNKNTLKWIKADVPLTTLTFGSSNKAINVDNTFYLNRLYNNENSPVDVKDYEPTKDTIFEVWKGNELQVKTTIKFWQQSTFNFNHRRFNPSGNTPTIALTGDFNGSDYYSVILTNMKKVS
jgi:hypothetical protein